MQGVKQPPRNGLADNRPGENYRQLKTENPNMRRIILLCQTPQQKRTYLGQLRNREKHDAKPVFENQHVALKDAKYPIGSGGRVRLGCCQSHRSGAEGWFLSEMFRLGNHPALALQRWLRDILLIARAPLLT